MRRMNRTMRRMTTALKRVSKAINRLVKVLLSIFVGAHMTALAKGAKTFITAVWGFIVKAMGALIAGFKKAALGLLKMAKRMMVVIGQFLAAAYAFIAGTLLPAIIAFLANPMTWIVIGIIALLVLIAVAWYFLITYMMENWEKVKVKMNMAADRLKLVGTKIANWFRDLGSDIGFIIKKMVAKIKDGFVYVVNAVIEGFARGIGSGGPVRRKAQAKLRSLKLTGGYSDKVDTERSTELSRRDARDAKLEADFEAKYAERGKELEEAEIKDRERNMKKTGGDGTEINAPTITEIDQRQVYHTSESTEITDQVTQTAVAVVQ